MLQIASPENGGRPAQGVRRGGQGSGVAHGERSPHRRQPIPPLAAEARRHLAEKVLPQPLPEPAERRQGLATVTDNQHARFHALILEHRAYGADDEDLPRVRPGRGT